MLIPFSFFYFELKLQKKVIEIFSQKNAFRIIY